MITLGVIPLPQYQVHAPKSCFLALLPTWNEVRSRGLGHAKPQGLDSFSSPTGQLSTTVTRQEDELLPLMEENLWGTVTVNLKLEENRRRMKLRLFDGEDDGTVFISLLFPLEYDYTG